MTNSKKNWQKAGIIGTIAFAVIFLLLLMLGGGSLRSGVTYVTGNMSAHKASQQVHQLMDERYAAVRKQRSAETAEEKAKSELRKAQVTHANAIAALNDTLTLRDSTIARLERQVKFLKAGGATIEIGDAKFQIPGDQTLDYFHRAASRTKPEQHELHFGPGPSGVLQPAPKPLVLVVPQ